MIQMNQSFLLCTGTEGTLVHLWGETAIHHEQIIHLLSAETIRVGFMLDESHRYARLQVTPYHIYPLHDKSRYSCRIILAQFLLSLSHRTLRHQKKEKRIITVSLSSPIWNLILLTPFPVPFLFEFELIWNRSGISSGVNRTARRVLRDSVKVLTSARERFRNPFAPKGSLVINSAILC